MIKTAVSHCLAVLLTLTISNAKADGGVTIPESVKTAMATSSSYAKIELLLSFNDDLDLAALKAGCNGGKHDRYTTYLEVMARLAVNRQKLETNLSSVFEIMMAEGKLESYRFFTVSKTVLVRIQADYIDDLLELPDLRLVNLNNAVTLIEPVEQEFIDPVFKLTLENNALEAVNIRSLWDVGLTGRGTLICTFDTGIDGDHPALGPKWRGNYDVPAAAAWFAPHGDTIPEDNIGHGTHVMGLLVGSTENDTIGIAPDAQWISAAVVDQGASFSTTIADILSAFDWALNPDGDIHTFDDVPDVICNSWGVPRGIYDDCNNTFWTAIDNVEAAGIVTIFAAGNEGPDPQTIRNPADRATSPINTLAVGAVDAQTLHIADFSSRGPAGCDGSAIKPELVAPGVNVYSTYRDGGYRLMSGTSMSAPFVAGLAALLRQYNPDASVDQIKTALLSATVDLGPPGEDNDYGHGLANASDILDFLDAPEIPQVFIHSHRFFAGGDAFADPGETAELTLTLNEPSGRLDSIDAWIISAPEFITVEPDTVRFRFVQGGSFSISLSPFVLNISRAAISGSTADLDICFSVPGNPNEDTLSYTVIIGHEPPGDIFDINTADINFSASDFGQFGFGSNSIYQAGGVGFHFGESPNLLYEAGIIISGNELLVSDAIRDSGGGFRKSDFIPMIKNKTPDAFTASAELTDFYNDDNAPLPIPIEVKQTIYTFGKNAVIMEFELGNPLPSHLDSVKFGFFCDYDIDRYGDILGYDPMFDMAYQFSPSMGIYIGILGVSVDAFAFGSGANDGFRKRGFSKSQKYDLINIDGNNQAGSWEDDWYMVLSQTHHGFEGFECKKTALAIVVGGSVNDLRIAAEAALSEYGTILDAEEENNILPSRMELSQNYPNPFNPNTTIRFNINSTKSVVLNVYNVIGQKVRTLYDGIAPAGDHSVMWDGRDESGLEAASGVYIYRFEVDGEVKAKRMILLK